MPLSQFLLPGEAVLFEAPGEVYFRRQPYAVYVTGERLLLHAAAGRFGGAERAVAEPLAAVAFAEYSEGGRLAKRARLDVHSAEHTLTLKGEPAVVVALWRALQEHALRPTPPEVDEEATLVAPPPPLFDDQPEPPARVQPLAPAPALRPPARKTWTRAALAAFVGAAVLVALVGAVLLGRRAAPPSASGVTPEPAPTAAPATPAHAPPTPLTLQVMDELFSLEGGSHHAVPFNVPAGPGAARVSGGFRVTNGGQVDFYVMNREQYERFAREGGPEITSIIYREGQWNARVGEQLPAGDYYLVFDNYDAGDDEPRTVAAEFFLLIDEAAAR